MKRIFGRLLAAGTLIALAGTAGAQADGEIVVPLSDSSRPVVLEVSAIRGSVTVIGTDTNEVRVAPLDAPRRIEPIATQGNAQGLRRIPNTSLGLTVEESDNITVEE